MPNNQQADSKRELKPCPSFDEVLTNCQPPFGKTSKANYLNGMRFVYNYLKKYGNTRPVTPKEEGKVVIEEGDFAWLMSGAKEVPMTEKSKEKFSELMIKYGLPSPPTKDQTEDKKEEWISVEEKILKLIDFHKRGKQSAMMDWLATYQEGIIRGLTEILEALPSPPKDQTEKECENPDCDNGRIFKRATGFGGITLEEEWEPCPDCQKDQTMTEAVIKSMEALKKIEDGGTIQEGGKQNEIV